MKTLLTLLSIILLVSCSKQKLISKRISGEWKPVSLRINEKNGIAEYVDATGRFNVKSNSKNENKGTYSLDIKFEYLGQVKSLQESGNYEIKDNEFYRTNDSLSNSKATVNYSNKEDMELDIPNLFDRRYLFIFKKNKD